MKRVAVVIVTLGVLVAGVIAGGLAVVGALVGGFVVLGGLEKLFGRHRYRTFRPAIGTDITYFFTSAVSLGAAVLVPVVLATLAFTVLGPLGPLLIGLRVLVQSQPGWLQAVEALLFLELTGYWIHRLFHEVPFLWRFHSVHHSSERLDWIAGFRIHPVEGLLAGFGFGPLLLLGFPAVTLGGIFLVIQAVTGALAHANVRWRLRPLHRVVLTPEFHHWHHANEPGAINTNYAGGLPIMDMVFGTYFMPKDRRPQAYGIADPAPPGFLAQLAHPFRRRTRQDRPTDVLAPLG